MGDRGDAAAAAAAGAEAGASPSAIGGAKTGTGRIWPDRIRWADARWDGKAVAFVRSSMRWVIGLRGQGMEGKGCFVLRFGGKAEARPEKDQRRGREGTKEASKGVASRGRRYE